MEQQHPLMAAISPRSHLPPSKGEKGAQSPLERCEHLTGGQLLHIDDELHQVGDRSGDGQFHRRMRRWS